MKSQISLKKIAIIGAGLVGSTIAYTLMIGGLVAEIVLIDLNSEKAKGEAMDLSHGIPFVNPVNIYMGSYKDCTNSDIIIITAGANQKEGESRIDLVDKNVSIFKGIINEIIKFSNDSILLVVTNPVDILTYVTYKLSGFPKNRVIGSGTVLDSSRFRYLIAQHINIDPRNVHAYILGEHGDTEVPIWSTANIAGITMDEYCNSCNGCNTPETIKVEIADKVKKAAYDIIKMKGATYYAVALAISRIVSAITRNENSILTVSSVADGHYNCSDVCLSLPTVVNKNGSDRIIKITISPKEQNALLESTQSLKEIINKITIF